MSNAGFRAKFTATENEAQFNERQLAEERQSQIYAGNVESAFKWASIRQATKR
jgi:hypothetical protein